MSKDRRDATDRCHYEDELGDRVRTCIQEYEQKYEDDMKAFFTKGGPNDAEISSAIFDQARRFAMEVLKGTEELSPIPGKPDDYGLVVPEFRRFAQDMEKRAAELLGRLKGEERLTRIFANDIRKMLSNSVPSDNTSLRVVWEMLFAACMEESIEAAKQAATRLLQLATICVRTKPTRTVIAFLREVSRCFVWGFDLPCVVLCRSVLDVSTEASNLKGKDLYRRIEAAPDALLDSAHKKKAHRVRKAGRDAVHRIACPQEDSLCVIQDTLAVLQRLTADDDK